MSFVLTIRCLVSYGHDLLELVDIFSNWMVFLSSDSKGGSHLLNLLSNSSYKEKNINKIYR